MTNRTEEQSIEEEWAAAEAALADARKMPSGAERIEALKKAGQLRHEADKRRSVQGKANRTVREDLARIASLTRKRPGALPGRQSVRRRN